MGKCAWGESAGAAEQIDTRKTGESFDEARHQKAALDFNSLEARIQLEPGLLRLADRYAIYRTLLIRSDRCCVTSGIS